MCYNLSRDAQSKKLEQRLNKGMKKKDFFKPQLYINGFGFPEIPIVKSEDKSVIDSAFWGFTPSHIKTESEAKIFRTKYLTLNCKSETVFSLPTFKSSIVPRRCIIPATGFFEHRHIDEKNKIPYFIKSTQDDIFFLAGIYTDYTNELGETKTTCSILTTDAGDKMSIIHNAKKRQPLVLDKSLEEVWLDPALKEAEIKELMKVFDNNNLYAHTIAKISPKTTNFSDPAMLAEVKYAEITD